MNKKELREMLRKEILSVMEELGQTHGTHTNSAEEQNEEYKDSYAAQKSAELRKKRDDAIAAAKREYEQSKEAQGKISKNVFKHSTNESTGPIRFKNLLLENPENRINLMRVQTVMEKLYPELTTVQSKKLTELCTEVHMMASQLNTKPYLRTEQSMLEWNLLLIAVREKLNELKDAVVSICEQQKIDHTTVVKVLDEVLSY